jgi:hypothetical protein
MCRSRLSNARVISLLRRAEAANLLIADVDAAGAYVRAPDRHRSDGADLRTLTFSDAAMDVEVRACFGLPNGRYAGQTAVVGERM